MIKVNIAWDNEASVYVATCHEIGLAVVSKTYDRLMQRIRDEVSNRNKCNKF